MRRAGMIGLVLSAVLGSARADEPVTVPFLDRAPEVYATAVRGYRGPAATLVDRTSSRRRFSSAGRRLDAGHQPGVTQRPGYSR